jgi:hypothetical protein
MLGWSIAARMAAVSCSKSARPIRCVRWAMWSAAAVRSASGASSSGVSRYSSKPSVKPDSDAGSSRAASDAIAV